MWALVVVVGLPAAWRNPTAAALVLCWIFSEGLYWITGNGLAVAYYTFPDIFVITVIFCKPSYCPPEDYPTVWHQLWCILAERTPADRLILLSYPACWYLYVADIAPYYQWWGLYWIAVVQFLAAGAEGIAKLNSRPEGASEASVEPPDETSRLVGVRGYG